jgi:hypothetical protein
VSFRNHACAISAAPQLTIEIKNYASPQSLPLRSAMLATLAPRGGGELTGINAQRIKMLLDLLSGQIGLPEIHSISDVECLES